MSTQAPHELDEDFDALWQRVLAARPTCLLADRSRQTLRWHFGRGGGGTRQAKALCVRRAGELAGYAVVTREDAPEIGLRRSRIVDLIAEGDDPSLLDTLVQAAFDQARASGSHILEVMGFPARIRERFIAGKAYARALPCWPYWYQATSPDLRAKLQHEDAWYGSAYDGDASL